MIAARQQCAVGCMMEMGWNKGVKRALHALERQGLDDEAIEFQAMSYRPVERMETDESTIVQAVLYVTCKALLAYQHGPGAAAWLERHAPCYASENGQGKRACCLDAFGSTAENRTRFAVDYITDALEKHTATPAAAAAKRAQQDPQARTKHAARLRSSASDIERSHKRRRPDHAAQPQDEPHLPRTLEDLLADQTE